MRPILADQTGSGGISGSGTSTKLAKWNGPASLTDSIIFSESGIPIRGKAASLDVSGSLTAASVDVSNSVHVGGNSDVDGNENVDGKLDVAGGINVSAATNPAQAGTVIVGKQDNALEGGEVVLLGGGNGGTPWASWNWDNFGGNLRWFTSAIVKMSLDTLGNLAAATINVTSVLLGNNVALSSVGTIVLIAANAAWTEIQFVIGAITVWKFNVGGHFCPAIDGNFDAGEPTHRVRDVYVFGEVVGGNEVKVADADQGTFVNVQTNINNLSFPVGINEKWICDFVIPVTMGVAATGVKFYFTFPAGTTGEITYEGNVATVITWQSLYQAVLTVPGTFFVTGIITGVVRLRAVIRVAGTAGTIQLVGITGGATTTCAVKKGASMIARRAA